MHVRKGACLLLIESQKRLNMVVSAFPLDSRHLEHDVAATSKQTYYEIVCLLGGVSTDAATDTHYENTPIQIY